MYQRYFRKVWDKPKPVSSKEIEEWMEKNAIECPVGRISKQQCIENRKRPKMNEKVDKSYMIRYVSGEIAYMPKHCYDCNIWKVFFTDDEIKKQEKEIKDFRKKHFTHILGENLEKAVKEISENIVEVNIDDLKNELIEEPKTEDIIKETEEIKDMLNNKKIKKEENIEDIIKETEEIKNKLEEKPSIKSRILGNIKESEVTEELYEQSIKRGKKIIRCKICNEISLHSGRGLCNKCYIRLSKNKLLNKYTNGKLTKKDLEDLEKIEKGKKPSVKINYADKESSKLKDKAIKSNKAIIICNLCGKESLNHGRGLCSKCYGKLNRRKLLDEYSKGNITKDNFNNILEENKCNFIKDVIIAKEDLFPGDLVYVIKGEKYMEAYKINSDFVNNIRVIDSYKKEGEKLSFTKFYEKSKVVEIENKNLFDIIVSFAKNILISLMLNKNNE